MMQVQLSLTTLCLSFFVTSYCAYLSGVALHVSQQTSLLTSDTTPSAPTTTSRKEKGHCETGLDCRLAEGSLEEAMTVESDVELETTTDAAALSTANSVLLANNQSLASWNETTTAQMAFHAPTASDQKAVVTVSASAKNLLVDMEHVDTDFLNSSERLSTAMQDLAVAVQLVPLLRTECHEIPPVGVSCVAYGGSGYISLHTWPLEGVITLDIFGTHRQEFLYKHVSTVEAYFGIPRHDNDDNNVPVRTVWAYKTRGFLEEPIDGDEWVLGDMQLDRKWIATEQTDFQRVDIVDVLEHKYAEAGHYDRLVLLDGVLQSRRFGDAAYHEALVHPAMFAHPNPKRVAIIGGGEGATLREVLKYESVERVVMIEIDPGMVEASRKFLPEWSDCSNLEGRAASCFDDPRTQLELTDAIGWLVDHFLERENYDEEDLFDVIIMDALDPSTKSEFSDILYDNNDFLEALSNSLGEEGIFAVQVGVSDDMTDAPETMEQDSNIITFLNGLEEVGFTSILEYDELHCHFTSPWAFMVAMKEYDFRARWFMTEAEVNLEIQKRIVRTMTGESPLRFFDGATMMTYQLPSKATQETWCREGHEVCEAGHGFDPKIRNAPVSSFEVRQSGVSGGGRGVFAKERIPAGYYLGAEDCVHSMFVPPMTYDLMFSFANAKSIENLAYWKALVIGYVDGYGWEDTFWGMPAAGVDPGRLTFMNHGCNGEYNCGHYSLLTEATAEMGGDEDYITDVYDDLADAHDPFSERNYPVGCQWNRALRDIESGEEVLTNYVAFGGSDVDDWHANMRELKDMCSGLAGTVTSYEESRLEASA